MLHKTTTKLIIHALFWVFYSIVLFSFNRTYYFDENINWYERIEVYLLALVFIISYCNDLVLLPYFMNRKLYISYSVVILVMIVLGTLSYCYIHCYGTTFECFSVDIWIIAIPIVTTSLIWMVFQFLNKQKELEKAHQDRIALELKFLKSQINPHVLFNSLNTIYAQAVKENERIAEMILMLSENLKYVLNQSNDTFVDLEKDITFIENYLEFQEVRTQGINTIFYNKEIDSYNHSIAPLILIDLIENAFKYAVYKDNALSDIWIDLRIQKGKLHFICKNEFDVNRQHEKEDTAKIGLKNLKHRLQIIYKDNYAFKITKDNCIFTVDLKINLE